MTEMQDLLESLRFGHWHWSGTGNCHSESRTDLSPYLFTTHHLFMFHRVRQLLEMIRFSHTLFALPFALLSAAMAWAVNGAAIRPCRFAGRRWPGSWCAWSSPAARPWPSTAWPTGSWTPLNPRTADRHLRRGVLGVGRDRVHGGLRAGFVAGTLLFLPRNPIPLSWPRCRCSLFLFGYSYSQAVHAAVAFLAGRGLDAGPAGGLGRAARRAGLAAAWCWGWR